MLIRICIALLVFKEISCTLSKGDKKSSKKQKISGLVNESVEDKGLVSSSIKWDDIVNNHAGYTVIGKPTNLTTLAYVTPWNNHGYDVAKIQRARFTFVSPVWLQIKPQGKIWTFTGTHDIDSGWISDVKEGGFSKVVPRLLFENWPASKYQEIFRNQELQKKLGEDLLSLVKKNKFDGLVLELWSQIPHQSLYAKVPDFIRRVCSPVRDHGNTCILVVPPPVYDQNTPGMFQRHDYEDLLPHIDFFSLMTYDFSSFQRPGANSPYWWVAKCIKTLAPEGDRSKILVGLNMYGLDHSPTGGRHVLGRDIVELLGEHKPHLQFDKKDREHFFEYYSEGRHTVFYPTPFSVAERVRLAREMGVGVSLWEVGQGLDFFYDLLY